MPEPLAIPPILHSTPPISKLTAISFGIVSVVIIASAAWSEWSPNPAFRAGMPEAIGVMFSGWPITPVEATTTSAGFIPSTDASRSLVRSAISTPFALQVFAFPLLHMTACALPSAI